MNKFEDFAIQGNGKELLTQALEANSKFIEGFDSISSFYVDNRGILVFCRASNENIERQGYTPYPFKLSTGMIVEHILSACDEVTEEQLELLGQSPNGYEEDYEYGWVIFKPTGSYYKNNNVEENKYHIDNYDWYYTVLAAYPIKIEYGK